MKRPRTTTTDITTLDFNQYSFEESARKKRMKIKNVVLDFVDYVEESILSRSGNVDRFNLVVRFNPRHREDGDFYIERWLNYAINHNVKEYSLSYHTNPSFQTGWRYLLPDSIYRSTSLQTLDLFGCHFNAPLSCYWFGPTLKKLVLTRAFIDQETLQNLVASCNRLEHLCIEWCEGFEIVSVASNKLRVLDLHLDKDKVQTVAVSAPNLRCASYGGGLEGVRGSLLASEFVNLEELRFHDVCFEKDGIWEVMIPDFPKLEKLQLERCGRGLDLLEMDRIQICSRFGKSSVSL